MHAFKGLVSMTTDTNQRLDELEARLRRIEDTLGLLAAGVATPQPTPDPSVNRPAAPTTPAPQSSAPHHAFRAARNDVSTTRVMAWGAALSFVLAGVYLIKLVCDAGWFTPQRQLGLATLTASALIAGGLRLARYDRQYAAFMPAVGVVVLYLTTYAAHLYYHFIGPQIAFVLVGAISLGALGLGRRFQNSAYAVLAALCVYLTPLLLETVRASLADLIIYFTAWSLVFSFAALQEGRRITYLVPLYLAFLAFDLAWRTGGDQTQWALAASYQFVQFLIFGATASYYSIRHAAAMDSNTASAHALPLLYFYALEYLLISQHAPTLAPILALSSAAIVLGLYLLAYRRLRLEGEAHASATLVSGYCALVTTHVVFFEWTPIDYLPWAVLVLPLALALGSSQLKAQALLPVVIIAAVLWCGGFLLVLVPATGQRHVPAPDLALFTYAVLFYLGYVRAAKAQNLAYFRTALLYCGHCSVMVVTVRVFSSEIMISACWAVLAVILLRLALRYQDRVLGQSSLLVFGASGTKVLLFDLEGSSPLVRIATLVILGASLYAGGWLYQGLTRAVVRLHPDDEIDAQLKSIKVLVEAGHSDAAIVERLQRDHIVCLATGGWTVSLIAQIRRDFNL